MWLLLHNIYFWVIQILKSKFFYLLVSLVQIWAHIHSKTIHVMFWCQSLSYKTVSNKFFFLKNRCTSTWHRYDYRVTLYCIKYWPDQGCRVLFHKLCMNGQEGKQWCTCAEQPPGQHCLNRLCEKKNVNHNWIMVFYPLWVSALIKLLMTLVQMAPLNSIPIEFLELISTPTGSL